MRFAYSQWIEYTDPLEGTVPYLYADRLGLATIWRGNLVDSADAVAALPLRKLDGTLAIDAEKREAFHAVKGSREAAVRGHLYARQLGGNALRLRPEDGEKLELAKLAEHERILTERFHGFAEMPACLQLCLHSMAWAMGAHFWRKFPRFCAHVDAGNFAEYKHDRDGKLEVTGGAAAESDIVPAHGTVIERNARQRMLLVNATKKGSPDRLEWRAELADEQVPKPANLNTYPTKDTTRDVKSKRR